MNNEKTIYFATKAVIVKDNKFLAMHKSVAKGPWLELPGGRMEFGESAEETLKREIFEETKLEVKPVKILDTWNYVGEDYQITGIIYLCEIESGEVTLSEEHDSFQWLDLRRSSKEKMHKAFRERMENWDWSKIKG